ncbi:MAG: hypothetical protein ABFD49_11575 [Armatimonadota bacterium]|nr:hypothetical protein [bacterium]
MRNTVTQIPVVLAAALLIILRPALPVWAGMGLVMLAISVGRADLCAPSARQRWAAFKRMVLVAATGIVLTFAGLTINCAPWNMQPVSHDVARHAMLGLLVYSVSLLGAPILGWAYLSHRPTPAARRIAIRQPVHTLSGIGHHVKARRIRTAA